MSEEKKKHKDKHHPHPEQPHENEIEKELREQVSQLSVEKEDLFGRLQRVSADYANYMKRVPKQIADSVAYEKEHIVKALLPVLDNFEHTLTGLENTGAGEDMIKGVQITYDHAQDALRSLGLEQISAIGQQFDPSLHQAMLQRNEPDKEPGVILEEFQKGYKLGDRVIRPSRVVVNKVIAPDLEPEPKKDEQPQQDENFENTNDNGKGME